MKYSFAIAALAAAVSAQSLGDVPKCAIPCLDDAIASKTKCDKTDLTCVCKNFDDVRSAATSCVITKCGSDTRFSPATEKLCDNPEAGSGSEGSSKTTTVPPVVESKTTAVPPVIETPTTKSEAAGSATSTPAPSGVGENSAAGLKGLGAMAMAALMALAL
ncbi:Extracellular membrane protein, CFEM domain [Fusarium oxysporum f. sp. vasinfectum]|nr:Extracellular membrane protein, CFEM domain [Fusarium oxysporum f. sp. vasinfectum]